MKILEGILQGSPEWLRARDQHYCASDLAAAAGVSKYKSRSELLREKATGITEEVSPEKQRLFDAGHSAEAAARSLVEATLSQELYPSTVTEEVDGLSLLASLDGITVGGDIIWENKLFNEMLAASVDAEVLGPHYWMQLEHQLLVTGAEKVYFTTSDGTPERTKGMWYTSKPERRATVISTWKQFALDVAAYVPPEVIPAAVAAPVKQLPALTIQVNGSITLIDNLKVFGEQLTAFIDGIDKTPKDDQAFADAELAIKTLQTAEDALEAAEANALAQTADIDTMRRTVKLYAEQARTTRLMLNALVKSQKEKIRADLVAAGKKALAEHIATLNVRLGKNYMPTITENFADAIKGKKTVASLRDACDTELARVKIEANAIADKLQINLNALREQAKEYAFLFNDTAALVMKEAEFVQLTITSRIDAHKKAKAEELAKIEADAKVKAERELREKTERETREKSEQEARAIALAAAPPAGQQLPTPIPAGATFADVGKPAPVVHAAPVASKPRVALTPQGPRPTADQIITLIAGTYRVTESRALEWMMDTDWRAVVERRAREAA